MAEHTNKDCCEFVKAKVLELVTYMETEQGFTRDKSAAVMLGLAAGWIAAARGKPVAYDALDMARLAIEQSGQTRN